MQWIWSFYLGLSVRHCSVLILLHLDRHVRRRWKSRVRRVYRFFQHAPSQRLICFVYTSMINTSTRRALRRLTGYIRLAFASLPDLSTELQPFCESSEVPRAKSYWPANVLDAIETLLQKFQNYIYIAYLRFKLTVSGWHACSCFKMSKYTARNALPYHSYDLVNHHHVCFRRSHHPWLSKQHGLAFARHLWSPTRMLLGGNWTALRREVQIGAWEREGFVRWIVLLQDLMLPGLTLYECT